MGVIATTIYTPWWAWYGTLVLVLLVVLVAWVPHGASIGGDVWRRARARRMVSWGAVGWAICHAAAIPAGLEYLRDIRILGAIATPRDHAMGLSSLGRALFHGWACLAASVLLAGIVLRGRRGGRWMPWILLSGCAVTVAAGFALANEPSYVEGMPTLLTWEAYQGPLVALAGLVATIMVLGSGLGLRKAIRARDPEAYERERLRLAGGGIVLLSAAVLAALIWGFQMASQVAMLNPPLRTLDVEAGLRLMLTVPSAFALLGLLAMAFGLLHLPALPPAREPASEPSPVGDNPGP